MRLGLFRASMIGFAGVICARADDLPTKLRFERYEAMLDHSPFAIASAVAAPDATPNFAKDLYIANAAKSAEGDMVTIASNTDKGFKKYLTSKTPVDGYAIAGIEWSDKVGETKVTISKDGQLATLNFNQMLSAQPIPNRAPVAVPLVLPQQARFQKPVAFPTPAGGILQRNLPGATPQPSAKE